MALRLIFRLPDATKGQIQAALLHDAMMAGGGGEPLLRERGVEDEAIRIVALTTPPPHGDYFRALEAITPEDNAIYRKYVDRLIKSGDLAALHMKLADFQDTCDMLSETTAPELKAQLHDRYGPARDRLAAALDRLAAALDRPLNPTASLPERTGSDAARSMARASRERDLP